jgi:hypothetical protein
MAEMMQHLTALADEIGPRPATTDAEHRAAAYIESVYVARGLEPEIQEFEAPRSYSWAYVIYHFLTIASAVISGAWLLSGMLVWLGFALSAITAFFLWSDLDTKWGLTRLMPKGPSQNVIARHIPKQRRGERMKKVIVVAHYDTARASLAFAPGMVGQFPLTFMLMKACTFAVPVMLLLIALPLSWLAPVHVYLWYASLLASAYLLIPLLIHVHREIAMPFVPGAGDNASGVAAMLGVLHNLVPEPDASRYITSQFPAAVRRGPEAAFEAGVVPEGSLLSYSPAGGRDPSTELPDDFAWAEPDGAPARQPQRGQARLPEFETIEFSAVDARTSGREAPSSRQPAAFEDWIDDEAPSAPVLPSAAEARLGAAEFAEKPKRGLLGGLNLGRKRKQEETADVAGWLGVDEEFDARKAGADIGSWDNFQADPPAAPARPAAPASAAPAAPAPTPRRKPVADDDDDDAAGGLGWKGGWAGDDPIEDDDFAANEAARIRRRVTEMVDRDLVEKEVWFVATGAEEVGTFGMQAFLERYGEDVRDALIINLDNVGAGQLSWVTSEGMARRYHANARLIGLARRVSREHEILVKPRAYKGLSTDATAALARGFKAMTLMAFDSAGLPVNWHWKTDTSDAIETQVVERATDLVTNMIREA